MDASLIKYGALLLAWVQVTASAQPLADPTRPPATRSAAMESDSQSTQPAHPALQSILISPRERNATINGQLVRIGDKFNNATVVRIVENEVTLRNGKQEHTLQLFRGIKK